MTIIKIWKAKRELYKIQGEADIKEQYEKIKNLANSIGAYIHTRNTKTQDQFIEETIPNIHIVLQTEMMLQACIFAAVAAFMSLISVVLFLLLR